jgi:7-cyano-7-deazaguanine synthase
MSKTRAVVPFSGGMDSTTILYHVKNMYDEVYTISFFYGQKHKKELTIAQLTAQKAGVEEHKLVDVSFFKEIASTSSLTNNKIDVAKAKDVMGDPQTVNYVPFRNMMLLSIACAYAETVGASTVYHGAAQADSVAGYWDGSPEFLNEINKVTALNRRNKIGIKAPLLTMSKGEIIKFGMGLGVNYADTWTCYEGSEKACGECTACALRIKGFIDAGVRDPLCYSKEIPWEKYIN